MFSQNSKFTKSLDTRNVFNCTWEFLKYDIFPWEMIVFNLAFTMQHILLALFIVQFCNFHRLSSVLVYLLTVRLILALLYSSQSFILILVLTFHAPIHIVHVHGLVYMQLIELYSIAKLLKVSFFERKKWKRHITWHRRDMYTATCKHTSR